MSRTTSGADLLQLALDWGSTPQERESRPSAVRFGGGALSVDGPADVAARLRDAVPSVDACRAVLESVCPLVLTGVGPYYVFPDVLSETVEADIRTDGDLPRPESWEPDEWAQLMAREFGPWAMAVVGGAVVSIAHTPRPLLDNAAEVGVWTHPGHRGRGLAAAITAAWAALLRPSGRHLFYSTAKDNHSSQRVAARLGLTLLGWTTVLWCARRRRRAPQRRAAAVRPRDRVLGRRSGGGERWHRDVQDAPRRGLPAPRSGAVRRLDPRTRR